MIFTQEIKDSYHKDVRQYPAVVIVPPGISQTHFPDKIGYLHELNNQYPLIKDFRNNNTLEIMTDALFYHPVRKKWIIWANSVCDARFQINGAIACTQHNLRIAFAPNEYEFIDLKQMLYSLDQIPVFNGMNLPVLPIKTEYADLLDLSKPIQKGISQGNQHKIAIPLLGTSRSLDVTFNSINNLENVEVFLDVWPNLPDWKTYWITSKFVNTDANGDLVSINREWNVEYFACNAQNKLLIQKIAEKPWNPYKKDIREALVSIPISDWPELISVYNGASKGCLIYNPKPIQMNSNPAVGVIGLDFGTARSVVCIADDGDHDTPGSFEAYVRSSYQSNQYNAMFKNESHLNPFKHNAKQIISCDKPAITNLKSGDYFAPITSHKQFNLAQDSKNPKILIVETGLKQLKNSSNIQTNHIAKVPFNHFTLPMMSEGDSNNVGVAQNAHTEPVNKWYKDASAHTQNFLKELLCLTLVEYWTNYPQSTANLLCSTPLAFSLDHHEAFKTNLLEAKTWLEKEVFPTNAILAWNGKTFPESVAAYTAAALYSVGTKDSLTVVADLGGGTLDLSIWYEKPGIKEKRILLSDSVQLGASKMFKALKKIVGTTGGLLDGDIYRFGYSKLQQSRNIPGIHWDKFGDKVKYWLNLNMAYIARSILATHYVQKETIAGYDLGKINVLLAGGGWKTCEALGLKPEQLEKDLLAELKAQIVHLDSSFNYELGVFSSLHRCGLEKVAIAGGLHNVKRIVNIPNGLKAPNGIDEITVENKNISWVTFVEESEKWLGISPKEGVLNNKPVLQPAILNIPVEYQMFDDHKLMMIQGSIQSSFTPQGGRRRTSGAVVFEHVLDMMLSSDIDAANG